MLMLFMLQPRQAGKRRRYQRQHEKHLEKSATTLQAAFRGHLGKMQAKKLRAATVINRNAKARYERKVRFESTHDA